MKKLLTLVLIERSGQVLLGMKKRGFGTGKWNGFGGKVKEEESIEEAASRETEEECGIRLLRSEEKGILDFEFAGNPELSEVHIFKAIEWEGIPHETEEMRPHWFNADQVPYNEMWPDDRFWLPLFLAGKRFQGRFLFSENDIILEQQLVEV